MSSEAINFLVSIGTTWGQLKYSKDTLARTTCSKDVYHLLNVLWLFFRLLLVGNK